jgi:hypothetical protein
MASAGCAGRSDFTNDVKADWLNGTPCQPPCWEGIEPGVTSPDEALELLQNDPSISQFETEDFEIETRTMKVVSWTYDESDNNWRGTLPYFDESEATVFAMRLDTPDLCLEEIIASYGEPELLDLPAYEVRAAVIVVWHSQGFLYWNDDIGAEERGIPDNLCGGSVILFPVGTSKAEIPSLGVWAGGELGEDALVPWLGFGDQYDDLDE